MEIPRQDLLLKWVNPAIHVDIASLLGRVTVAPAALENDTIQWETTCTWDTTELSSQTSHPHHTIWPLCNQTLSKIGYPFNQDSVIGMSDTIASIVSAISIGKTVKARAYYIRGMIVLCDSQTMSEDTIFKYASNYLMPSSQEYAIVKRRVGHHRVLLIQQHLFYTSRGKEKAAVTIEYNFPTSSSSDNLILTNAHELTEDEKVTFASRVCLGSSQIRQAQEGAIAEDIHDILKECDQYISKKISHSISLYSVFDGIMLWLRHTIAKQLVPQISIDTAKTENHGKRNRNDIHDIPTWFELDINEEKISIQRIQECTVEQPKPVDLLSRFSGSYFELSKSNHANSATNNSNQMKRSRTIPESAVSNTNSGPGPVEKGDETYPNMNFIHSSSNVLKSPLRTPYETGVGLAIIVPYRDQPEQNRLQQLERFIEYMPKFIRQNVKPKPNNFHIFIVEQSHDGFKFNRGKLLNIGCILAHEMEFQDTTGKINPQMRMNAFCLHDVDLLPAPPLGEFYGKFPYKPIHIAHVWSRYSNMSKYYGGILTLSDKQIRDTNGYPNNFWGWGGEDDEIGKRLQKANLLDLERPDAKKYKGAITDTEEELLKIKGGIRAGQRLKEGGKIEFRNMRKYELLSGHEATWKTNGIKDLQFKIMGRRRPNRDVTIFTVDLLAQQYDDAAPLDERMIAYDDEALRLRRHSRK